MRTFRSILIGALALSVSLASLLSLGSNVALAVDTKLALTASMVHVEPNAQGDGHEIVDEQALSGDPPTGSPTTQWFAGWAPGTTYPASAYLDLGQNYSISKIYVYDSNGISDLTVASGSPGSWTTLFVDSLSNFQTWNLHTVSVTTRYIRLSKTSDQSNFNEIVIYGSAVGGPTNTPTNTPLPPTNTPTNTPIGPTNTPTWTNTPIPPTNTPTNTAIVPTNTPTNTPVPPTNTPTSTDTPIGPTNTPTNTSAPGGCSGLVKIPGLTAASTVGESGDYGSNAPPGNLTNEQAAVGDPPSAAPTSAYRPGFGTPPTVYINLGAVYCIKRIYWWDSIDTGTVSVYTGSPSNWTLLTTFTNDLFQQWQFKDLTATNTQYVRLAFSGYPEIGEFVIYAGGSGATLTPTNTPTKTSTPTPTRTITPGPSPTPTTAPVGCQAYLPRPSITVDQFLGVNSFVDVPNDAVAPFGNIREYHNWNWDEGDMPWSGVNYGGYPNNPTKWNPAYAGGGGWNFDGFYGALTGLNILVSPSMKDDVYWLHTNVEGKPTYPQNASRTDPAITENPNSYIAHADHLYQMTARYGSATIADANLKLAAGQPRSTGLNYIKYYENWNEPDKYWTGPAGSANNFTPAEFAALMSADYDGNCRSITSNLGYKVGVKNADPNARMAMGGLAGPESGNGTPVNTYLDGIKAWANAHRGGSLPMDVINFHHYSTSGSAGISPEADNLKAFLQNIISWRNTNAPNMETWYSEFGWDNNQGSVKRAPPIGPFNTQQVQGQWILRTYLISLGVGIDRAQVFVIRDNNPNSSIHFDSMGVTGTQAAGYPRKVSWYYIYTMKNRLAGMKWRAEQASGNPNVWIYTFKNQTTGAGAYVLWSPTSNNTTVNGYVLSLQGSPTSATLVTLNDTSTTGNASALTISGGTVTVNVSESPIFVLTNSIP